MSIYVGITAKPAVHSPHPLEHRIISKISRIFGKTDIKTYLEDGGLRDLRKAVKMSRADIGHEVKTSVCAACGGRRVPLRREMGASSSPMRRSRFT